jgi:ketosteroid isomerase-like protein
MGATENKELVRRMGAVTSLDEMLGLLADDVRYTVIGRTKYSGTFVGKQELVEKLIAPLMSQLEGLGTTSIDTIVADGDHVVVQSRAHGRRTKSGSDYNNTYCMVYRIADGRVKEITEYLDTELVTAAFGPPPRP